MAFLNGCHFFVFILIKHTHLASLHDKPIEVRMGDHTGINLVVWLWPSLGAETPRRRRQTFLRQTQLQRILGALLLLKSPAFVTRMLLDFQNEVV